MSDHVSQLTEELKKKTKLIQSFLLREQHGRIKPPGKEQELHKKVNSIMDTIYAPNSTGKNYTRETRAVRGRIGVERKGIRLRFWSQMSSNDSQKITEKYPNTFSFRFLLFCSNFVILENINMMRDVNKQLQLVLEDTLFKVFYMQVMVTPT